MIDILNALPYFGLIFIASPAARAKALPERARLDEFFLLYVRCRAVLRILAKTPFENLEQPAVCDRDHHRTAAGVHALGGGGRLMGGCRCATPPWRGSPAATGNIGYMGPGLARRHSAPRPPCRWRDLLLRQHPVVFAVRSDAVSSGQGPAVGPDDCVRGETDRVSPLIVAGYCGTIAAAFHLHPPVAIDNTLQFLQGAVPPWRCSRSG